MLILLSIIVEDKGEDIYMAMFKSEEWPMLDRGIITEEGAIGNIVDRNKEDKELFDGGVVSYKEKLLKPEAEIYNTLVNGYGLIKEEIVFIDDTKENVDEAIRLGINGTFLENSQCLIKELRKFNINI